VSKKKNNVTGGSGEFDPLIIHVSGLHQAQALVSGFPAKACELTNRFWPGPLSIVLPKADKIVTAGLRKGRLSPL
jgi:L-threonylcarbamoyladenylate synthase